MKPAWAGVRKVVAARLDNIGDVVLLSPALRALKENLLGVQITLWGSPAGVSAAALLPEIDDVLEWKVVWQDVGGRMPLDPERELRLIAALRQRCFEAAIIFTSFSQSPHGVAYACYLAGIPLRLGQSKEFGGSLLTMEARAPSDSLHQAERNLHLLSEAGLTIADRRLSLTVPQAARASAEAKLGSLGLAERPFVVIHPGASCTARAYLPGRYGQVASLLATQLGAHVLLTAADRDRTTVKIAVDNASTKPAVLVGETSVPEWAAIIERSSLVITNNTGALHIADALRVPSVVMYSGTDLLSQWAPRDTPNRLLQRPTWCSPCYNFSCPYQMECLDISPAEVVEAARDLLYLPSGSLKNKAIGES